VVPSGRSRNREAEERPAARGERTAGPAASGGGAPGGRIWIGDNLPVLRSLAPDSVDLVYVDPPFNTGRARSYARIRTVRAADGDRVGFQGRRYRTLPAGSRRFPDAFDDYLAFLEPRLREARRVLKPTGSLYFHIDYRECHYCKLLLDELFGRSCFLNEVIWAYDYGARSRRRWPAKHDNILVYVKDPELYYFDLEGAGRIPYLAPGLVGPEKAARGKTPTDTWWHTIVPTNGRERTGYPTQKPLGILERIVGASSPPGGTVLDCFAGSGTTGEACRRLGRRFLLIDENPEALQVMAARFGADRSIEWIGWEGPKAAPEPASQASGGSHAALAARGRPVGDARGRSVGGARGRPVGDACGRPAGGVRGRPVGDARGRSVGDVRGRPAGGARGRPARDLRGVSARGVRGPVGGRKAAEGGSDG